MTTSRRELLANLPMVRIPVQYNDSHPTAPAAEHGNPAVDPDLVPDGTPEETPDSTPPAGAPPEPEPPRLPRPGRIPLPRFLTRFLRSVAGLDLAAGAWLLLVGAHRTPCVTRLCEVATLEGRHHAAGLTAVIAAILLAGAALFTSGLTRADSVTTTVLIAIALTGLLAAIGVVLAAALILSVVGLALGAVIAILVGAIRGDLTR
jgi:hypothetical protein